MSRRQVAVALLCFADEKGAAKARKPLEATLQSNGDTTLQTTILRVNAKHKASVHDPRRVLAGTLTAALTWGLFGLLAGTDKIESAVVWALLGALCGGVYAYTSEHLLTNSELTRIGRRLAAGSSALVAYAEASDPQRLLAAAGAYGPSTASVASIDPDLDARVFAGTTAPVEVSNGSPRAQLAPDETSVLSMIVSRYSDPKAATRVAAQVARRKSRRGHTPEIELVIETDAGGHRHVTDPHSGTAAWARSDTVSWGAFGLVWGGIVGALGGGGILGFLEEGLVTGIGWAVFGLVAGALYGLWAGRSISARRLKGIGPILAPGTSTVLAWADGAVRDGDLEPLAGPGAQHLVLSFNPVDHGAVLEAA